MTSSKIFRYPYPESDIESSAFRDTTASPRKSPNKKFIRIAFGLLLVVTAISLIVCYAKFSKISNDDANKTATQKHLSSTAMIVVAILMCVVSLACFEPKLFGIVLSLFASLSL